VASMPAEDVDDVIVALTSVVDEARHTGHRRGYFAAVYRAMTLAVRDGIEAGSFDDGPRMRRFVAVFANRYLDALAGFQTGIRPTRVWRACFECNERSDRLILQQVVVGMNAHINLDLGVAAAEVTEGTDIRSMKADFNRINDVIASLLDPIQSAIGRFSPLLDLLWKVSDRPDDEVLTFSFRVAREQAWQQAVLLAGQLPEDRPATIEAFDRSAVLLTRLVSGPGGLLGRAVAIVRHTEQEDVPSVIDTLSEVTQRAV
jgi:hypothetical protein